MVHLSRIKCPPEAFLHHFQHLRVDAYFVSFHESPRRGQSIGSTKRELFVAWFSDLPSTLGPVRTEHGLSVVL
jgi:hypothetical protein